MDWPGFTKRILLEDGRICDTEAALLRREVLAGGVTRKEIGLMVRLKREAVTVLPAFDALLFEVLRAVVLADGQVSDDDAEWLRGSSLRTGPCRTSNASSSPACGTRYRGRPGWSVCSQTCLGWTVPTCGDNEPSTARASGWGVSRSIRGHGPGAVRL